MNHLKQITSYFLMLPAIILGIYAMISNGVATSIWLQNILIWLVGTVMGSIYLLFTKKKQFSKGNMFLNTVLIALLVLPFLFDGIEGVHRWVTVGPINIYIASVVLPFFIIQLWKLALHNREGYTLGLVFITLLLLVFQPDAGQLTAFACASAIIVWKKIGTGMIRIFSIVLITIFVIYSWVFLDELAPISYVEDIIFLVADLGMIWFVLGILSLLLLLLPFVLVGKKNIISITVGVYFLMAMLVTFFGNFPLPIMGYGISPIIGYMIAITWLMKNRAIMEKNAC